MGKLRLITMLLLFIVTTSGGAFTTNDERIDHYLSGLTTMSIADKEKMLNRLQ